MKRLFAAAVLLPVLLASPAFAENTCSTKLLACTKLPATVTLAQFSRADKCFCPGAPNSLEFWQCHCNCISGGDPAFPCFPRKIKGKFVCICT
jgi:hypothetical protein